MNDVLDRVPLGDSTLASQYYLDVNTGTIALPVWTAVGGVTNLQPTQAGTLQDDSDYDSGGDKSSTVTAMAWGVSLTVARKVQAAAATAYDPGQETLRLASYQKGVGNSVQIRYYEMTPGGPRVEAFQGMVAVEWAPAGGAMDALNTVQVTLTGQGKRNAIQHPDTAAQVPAIVTLSPANTAVAGGALIEINGSGFTNATQVAVGGVNLAATAWKVISDSLIAFTAPAHAAGAVNVTVTNANGTSGAQSLTYA